MRTTLTNVRTDARTYREAGFFLHATVTITVAPVSTMTVVQYPWRSGESSSRVGQTKSPPCPDRRNFISERIADFTRNHPLIYAAATITGDGLIVEIAPDARVALPTAQTLTNDFTFTLRAGQISLSAPIDVEVRISGGNITFPQPSIPNSIILLTDVDVFPVPAAMAMIRNLRAPSFSLTVRAQARIRLPKNLVLTEGENLTVPRGAIARGGADSKFVGCARPCDLESGAARLGRLPAAKRHQRQLRRPRQSNPNRIGDRLDFERYAPARIGRGRDLPRFVPLARRFRKRQRRRSISHFINRRSRTRRASAQRLFFAVWRRVFAVSGVSSKPACLRSRPGRPAKARRAEKG